MDVLSAREVEHKEALRLGVTAGWYSTKVSGTFLSGPHATQGECEAKITELNPPPVVSKARRRPA
jgi:hypothetical protein